MSVSANLAKECRLACSFAQYSGSIVMKSGEAYGGRYLRLSDV